MKKPLRLLLALLFGVLSGTLLHPYSDLSWLNQVNTHLFQPIGQIFLRLIFMIVVPLVFSSLVLGVFELAREHGLGRIVSKTLFYTLVSSTFSVLIGIALVNGFKPGVGFQIQSGTISSQESALGVLQKNAASAKPFSQILVDLIPKNPLDSATRALDGEMLSLMLFALLFGIALSRVGNAQEVAKSPPNAVILVLEQVFAACMKIVDFALVMAPLAVFCLVFNVGFRYGTGFIHSLLSYVLIVVTGLLIQQFVVYSALLKGIGRQSPLKFFKQCREVYLVAFSTASSNATLPTSLATAENQLKLEPRISRFVLTVGSTANQNGTALFEGVTVLFLAQVYGISLTLVQQVQVVLMSILAGIGTAGVPGGSLPLILILLQSVGIPAEGLGLILGVDRFLDMCRTTVNVSGDLVIAALVSKKNGEGIQN